MEVLLVQKDEQLAHVDEQLAIQASQLAKNAAKIHNTSTPSPVVLDCHFCFDSMT
jgi:hypothetical protein